jgi:hypothetical protein
MSSLADVETERRVETHCFSDDVTEQWKSLELIPGRQPVKTNANIYDQYVKHLHLVRRITYFSSTSFRRLAIISGLRASSSTAQAIVIAVGSWLTVSEDRLQIRVQIHAFEARNTTPVICSRMYYS